jgi:hypothetical protein
MKSIIFLFFAIFIQQIHSFTRISTVAHYVNSDAGFMIRYVLVDYPRNIAYVLMLDSDGY